MCSLCSFVEKIFPYLVRELFTAKERIEHKELSFIIHDRCSFYVILAFLCGKNLPVFS
jgi:hypothetical protein